MRPIVTGATAPGLYVAAPATIGRRPSLRAVERGPTALPRRGNR
jgi:hypothetical protein